MPRSVWILVAAFLGAYGLAHVTGPAIGVSDAVAAEAKIAPDLPENYRQMLEENPSLLKIYRQDPGKGLDILEQVYRMLLPTRTLAPSAPYPIGVGRPGPEDKLILDTNPTLTEIYRTSPEAALDLIRLIREAVNK